MFPFQNLDVWHRAHRLAVVVLKAFPESRDSRLRGLAEQTWRAATSISANIAEGSGSASHAVFARHLGVALGSAHELENHLMLARDAGIIGEQVGTRHLGEVVEIKRMLWALREKVKRDPRRKQKPDD
jgi:four helix bundle protein